MKDDDLFKSIAEAYTESEAQNLLAEADMLNMTDKKDYSELDKRIKKITEKKNLGRFIPYVSLAASIIALMFFVRMFNFNTPKEKSDIPSSSLPVFEASEQPPVDNIEFIRAKLPSGYMADSIKFDVGETLFYVKSRNGNDIIISVKDKNALTATDLLEKITVDGVTAYGRSQSDYNLLTFKSDGYTFTLTNMYAQNELISIMKKIIV